MIGVFVLHPNFTLPAVTTFSIKIGPVWPIMFVTIACGAISGWHSIVSARGRPASSRTRLDARPVGAGVMFVEMMLALFALIIAGTIYASPAAYGAAAASGPGAIFATGVVQVPRRAGPARGPRPILRQRHDGGPCHHHHAARHPLHARRHAPSFWAT